MSARKPVLPAPVAAAVAALGVLMSHSLGYLLAAPDAHERARLLDVTGHQYFGIVAAVSAGLAAGALARYVARASHGSGAVMRFKRRPAASIIVIQSAGLLGMETIERILSSAPNANPLGERAVLWAIALQVIIALFNILLLRSLVSVIRKLRAPRPQLGNGRPRVVPGRSRATVPTPIPGKGGGTLRGPPLLRLLKLVHLRVAFSPCAEKSFP